ncbi:MAG TPA: L-threonylcarbamoyladenylate synthase [Candidatus Baltobacteraceae bacterium]|jgi:L-threonylcarbamoyladenylate synthase|nr:L-threonylcarbamoyladenylate synthase [Candidatus Baltobacteraceae bacterium]
MRKLDARRMQTNLLLEEVRHTIIGGGTLIFPTETVYGIGCDPMRADAIDRIFASKGRPRGKPLALHLATPDEALEYIAENPSAVRAVHRFLPGPLAVIVARPGFVNPALTAGLPSLSLRVPNHSLCREILDCCGPLAATSANRSGEPAFVGGKKGVLPQADLFIDSGAALLGIASTVVDFTTSPPKLVREGAITREILEAELGPLAVSIRAVSNEGQV